MLQLALVTVLRTLRPLPVFSVSEDRLDIVRLQNSPHIVREIELSEGIVAQLNGQRKLAAILAADVVGYSRLMALDELGTHSRLNNVLAEVFRPTVKRHAGRIFKMMGDGALVEFASVNQAVDCAVELQTVLEK